jgi:hypothetical protein
VSTIAAARRRSEFGGAAILSTDSASAAGTDRITCHPCAEHESDQGLRCGSITLPVDLGPAGRPAFELALARRPAADPAARIGTLIFHPGGPGLSGVDAVFDVRYFNREILCRFDIVGFDPRDVGRSKPVVCSTELLAKRPRAGTGE